MHICCFCRSSFSQEHTVLETQTKQQQQQKEHIAFPLKTCPFLQLMKSDGVVSHNAIAPH